METALDTKSSITSAQTSVKLTPVSHTHTHAHTHAHTLTHTHTHTPFISCCRLLWKRCFYLRSNSMRILSVLFWRRNDIILHQPLSVLWGRVCVFVCVPVCVCVCVCVCV